MNLHEIISNNYIHLAQYITRMIFFMMSKRGWKKNGWGGVRGMIICVGGGAIFGNLLCELISLLNKFEFSRTPPPSPGRSTHDAYV